MAETGLVQILEGAILAAGKPLTVQNLADLFEGDARPENSEIRAALKEVAARCEDRGFELQEVASGFRFAVRRQLSQWVGRLWVERPARYSRALLETLALIAYRQPVTRGEIEEIRGVAVSTNIIKTLHERDWIRVVGHRDVPGRPAMYATTRQFLDYFNLKSLDQLPALVEIRDFDSLTRELGFEDLIDPPAEIDAEPTEEAVTATETDGTATGAETGADMGEEGAVAESADEQTATARDVVEAEPAAEAVTATETDGAATGADMGEEGAVAESADADAEPLPPEDEPGRNPAGDHGRQ